MLSPEDLLQPNNKLVGAKFPDGWSVEYYNEYQSIAYFDANKDLKIILSLCDYASHYAHIDKLEYTTLFVSANCAEILKTHNRIIVPYKCVLPRIFKERMIVVDEKHNVSHLKQENETIISKEYYSVDMGRHYGDGICRITKYTNQIVTYYGICNISFLFPAGCREYLALFFDEDSIFGKINMNIIPSSKFLKQSDYEDKQEFTEYSQCNNRFFKMLSDDGITASETTDENIISVAFPDGWHMQKYVMVEGEEDATVHVRIYFSDPFGINRLMIKYENGNLQMTKLYFTKSHIDDIIPGRKEDAQFSLNFRNERDIMRSFSKTYSSGNVIAYFFSNGQFDFNQQEDFWNSVSYNQRKMNEYRLKRKTQFDNCILIGFFDSINNANEAIQKIQILKKQQRVVIDELANGLSTLCKDYLDQMHLLSK